MITVTLIHSTYIAPDEYDCDPMPDSVTDEWEMTFRELVMLMRDYPMPSCSPASGATYEWLNDHPEQDYRTGEIHERSMHFSRSNPPRRAKYWRKAMLAAGIIRRT